MNKAYLLTICLLLTTFTGCIEDENKDEETTENLLSSFEGSYTSLTSYWDNPVNELATKLSINATTETTGTMIKYIPYNSDDYTNCFHIISMNLTYKGYGNINRETFLTSYTDIEGNLRNAEIDLEMYDKPQTDSFGNEIPAGLRVREFIVTGVDSYGSTITEMYDKISATPQFYNNNNCVVDGSEPENFTVYGCMDSDANNYNGDATEDDGSCVYPIKGCMNSTAINYISWAEVEDKCIFGPNAIAGQNITGIPGVPVQFSGAGIDEDGTVEKYEWDFDGDGIFEWSSFENGLNTYIYNNEGTYTATLRVTDNDGFTDTDSLTVTVKSLDNEDDEGIPSISLITSLISIGLLAIFRRK